MPRKSLVALVTLVLVRGAASASGGSAMPAPPAPAPVERRSPTEEAVLRYNEGLRHQEKAKKLALEATTDTADPKKREKIEAQARKEYERAMKEFQAAIENNPNMFQAHSGLGYTLRKIGSYDAALGAYDRALQLEPRYSPAIEYRAEAYLELDRLEEAKSAYVSLFAGDRKRADELHGAMKTWLEKHRQDAHGVSSEVIEDFAKWIAEREEIAGRASALTQPENDRW